MFDIARPLLVFETQTHNVMTGKLSGFIFRYYEYHYRKPRELFFSDPIEARVFAQKKGADFSMLTEHQPEVVTALDYVMNHDPFSHYPQGDTEAEDVADYLAQQSSARRSAEYRRRKRDRRREVEDDRMFDEDFDEEDAELDWFGEDEA